MISIKTGLELTEDLHRRIKSTAATRGLKMKDATRQAFEAWLDSAIHITSSTMGSIVSETSAPRPSYNPAIQDLLEKIAVDPKRLEAVETVLRDIADAALEPHGIRSMQHPEVIEIKAGSTRQKLDDCLRRIKELAEAGRPGAAYFAQGDDPRTAASRSKGAKNRRRDSAAGGKG